MLKYNVESGDRDQRKIPQEAAGGHQTTGAARQGERELTEFFLVSE
jgi:hypothetical protein